MNLTVPHLQSLQFFFRRQTNNFWWRWKSQHFVFSYLESDDVSHYGLIWSMNVHEIMTRKIFRPVLKLHALRCTKWCKSHHCRIFRTSPLASLSPLFNGKEKKGHNERLFTWVNLKTGEVKWKKIGSGLKCIQNSRTKCTWLFIFLLRLAESRPAIADITLFHF